MMGRVQMCESEKKRENEDDDDDATCPGFLIFSLVGECMYMRICRLCVWKEKRYNPVDLLSSIYGHRLNFVMRKKERNIINERINFYMQRLFVLYDDYIYLVCVRRLKLNRK